jgi:hypothetical protein
MQIGLIVALWLIPAAALAQFEKLPKVVQDAVTKQQKECGERVDFKPDFVATKDINGDGIDDYILDYGNAACGNFESFWCGTGGCQTQVFASLPNGDYAKVLNIQVRQIEFKTVRKRPAIVLDFHGSRCGGFGPDPCPMTLVWNGKTFETVK